MAEITIIGGGLAGLIAAVECAEAGKDVRILEARSRLGGRATSTPGPWIANLGPHALYTRGPLWDWLVARDLHQPFGRPPMRGARVRYRGVVRTIPPLALLKAVPLRREDAPVGVDLRSWVVERRGEEVAQAVAMAAGVFTFDHDPGRLSAAFVWQKVARLTAMPPVARYVVGGWSALVERIAARAQALGVEIELGAKVDEVVAGPTIVAVAPAAARRLLCDDRLDGRGTRSALLDVGLAETVRTDPYLVVDLDEGAFVDRFTAVDPTVAPGNGALIQGVVGMRPGETLDDAERRLEAVLDDGWPRWRERVVWRRRAAVTDASGALDLPGQTWRDRVPIAYADGVWLAGDWVAAPGHLAEVACNSARAAAAEACAKSGRKLVAVGGSGVRAAAARPR